MDKLANSIDPLSGRQHISNVSLSLPVHAVFDDGGAFVVDEAIIDTRAPLLGNAADT